MMKELISSLLTKLKVANCHDNVPTLFASQVLGNAKANAFV
jgi:hypothetical protein